MQKKYLIFTAIASLFAAGTILALVSCDAKNQSEFDPDYIIEHTTSESVTSEETATSSYGTLTAQIRFNTLCEDVKVDAITQLAGSPLTLPQPEREGYEFVGWYTESSLKHIYTDSVFPSSDKVLYARWSVKEYTLSFDIYGDGTLSSSLVRYGDVITYPVPSMDGYTFLGWKHDLEEELPLTMPSHNLTITAEWEINKYHYSYELNGGINSEKNLGEYTIEMKDNTLYSPTREGYTFTGWYADAGMTERIYVYPLFDTTIYASWKVNAYTVSLENSKGDYAANENVYNYGENVNLPTLECEGYTFVGWFDEEGTKYETSFLCTGDITLTARWEIVTYAIRYELNGGEFKENPPSSYTVEDKPLLVSPVKEGYTFNGWYRDARCNTRFAGFSSGDTTLYAKFTIDTYTLNYDSNGGTMLNDEVVTYGTTVSLQTPTRTGYTFAGWQYGSTLITDFSFVMPGENVSLKAVWNINHFNFTLDYNYDDISETEDKDYLSEITLPTPERTGYTFLGWYNGTQKVSGSVFTMPNREVTLTANWGLDVYKATYSSAVKMETNKNLTSYSVESDRTLKDPSITGYTFLGWYKTSEYKEEDKVTELPLSNITLYAHFEINTYTITYHYSGYGAQGSFVTSYTILDEDITIPTIVRESSLTHTKCADFLGWYKESDFVTSITSITWDDFKDLSITLTDGKPVGQMDIYAHEEAYFTHTENGNNDSITGITTYAINKFKGGTLTLPSEIDGWTMSAVSSLNPVDSITKVILEEGIKEIQKAFVSWSSLTEIEMPSTLTSLGEEALKNTGLSGTFSVPSTVKVIENSCFSGTSVSVLDLTKCSNVNVSSEAFYGMKSLTVINVSKNFVFAADSFEADTPLSTINFEGSKQQFETNETSFESAMAYSFGASSDYVIQTEDGCTIYKDKTSLIPLKLTYDGKTITQEIQFAATGMVTITFPEHTDRTNYHYEWYGSYPTYIFTIMGQTSAFAVANQKKTYSMFPYPCELNAVSVAGQEWFTITYRNTEGTNIDELENVLYEYDKNSMDSYTLPSISKVGYAFEGWYKSSTFGTEYKIETITDDTISSDLYLYPCFAPIYTLDSNNAITGITKYYMDSTYYKEDPTVLHLAGFTYGSNYIDTIGTITSDNGVNTFVSVVIEEGITTINDNAFSTFSFEQITLSAEVTTIGKTVSTTTKLYSDDSYLEFKKDNIMMYSYAFPNTSVIQCSDGNFSFSLTGD